MAKPSNPFRFHEIVLRSFRNRLELFLIEYRLRKQSDQAILEAGQIQTLSKGMFLVPTLMLVLVTLSSTLIVSIARWFHQKLRLFLILYTDVHLVRADKEDLLPKFYGRVKDLHWQQKISGNLICNSKQKIDYSIDWLKCTIVRLHF